MENGKYKIDIEHRITSLEADVKTILENHLPHLHDKLDKIDNRTWWILGTLILGFVFNIFMTIR